jgi:hypothetical protein
MTGLDGEAAMGRALTIQVIAGIIVPFSLPVDQSA